MFGGTDAGIAVQSGSDSRTAAIVSETVAPGAARCPLNISYSTAPNAQMSVRLSTGSPRACSGLMYAAVPSLTPSWLSHTSWELASTDECSASGTIDAFANPKSSTLTTPSGVILMLAGFRSR